MPKVVALSVLLLAAAALAQSTSRGNVATAAGGQSVSPDYTGCANLIAVQPIRCPNQGCGETHPAVVYEPLCDPDSPYLCIDLQYGTWCCGAYQNYVDTGDCIYAEVRHDPLKSRILELAKERDILVPTCGSAYVPAGLVLRAGREKSGGGS